MKGVYVHIPFCLKKCQYCDFNSYAGLLSLSQKYVEAVLTQMEGEYKSDAVDTLYFGGGTPTTLPTKDFEKLLKGVMKMLCLTPECEITMEANVSSLNYEKLELMKKYGVNRLSMGLQAVDNTILKEIGRTHTLEQFEKIYYLARNGGFSNISVDLMFGLPGQDLEGVKKSVQYIIALNPEHISAYSLTIAEGTPFAKELPHPLPTEDEERKMYHYISDSFQTAGYEHYEISNFAKFEKQSRHNLKYWKCMEYYGFGAGASGYLNNERFTLEKDPKSYIEQAANGQVMRYDREILSEKDRINEFVFLSLRLMEGICESDFYEKFKLRFTETFQKKIDDNLQRGLIKSTKKGYALTKVGLDFADFVIREFLL